MLRIAELSWTGIPLTGLGILLWLTITTATAIVILLKSKTLIPLTKFLTLGASYMGIGLAIRLGWRAIVNDKFYQLLGVDIWVLELGVIAIVWLPLEEIWNVITKLS
jgi:hypothetical protein